MYRKLGFKDLCEVYYYLNNVCYTTWAMSTNEMKELSEEECKRLNIDYNLVSVYPWENVEEELKALNED